MNPITVKPGIRFDGYTEDWEQRKLSDMGEVITGSTPSTHHPEYYSEDGIPWVTPTDIVDNVISDTPRKLSSLGEKMGRVVPADTILVTCIASIGKNTMLLKQGSFNQQINGLVPDKKKYDAYFLLTESFHWSAKMKRDAAAGTMQIVNKNEFSAIETYVPELSEQKAVGDCFRQIDKFISLHQCKYDKLKSIKKAMLDKMFPQKGKNIPEIRFDGFKDDWEVCKLSDIGEIITGSTPSTHHPEYYSENGIPWVTPTDIVDDVISDTPRKLSPLGEKVGRVVPADTILVTCIASIGKNTMLGKKGSFNQQINGLVPDKEKYDPYFLLTESFYWSAKMKREAAAGTMQIVNKKDFSVIETYVPELSEQKAIGDYFQLIDTLIILHQRKLLQLKVIKSALLQKMYAN